MADTHAEEGEGNTSTSSKILRPFKAFLRELGLITLFHASTDTKILILQRFVRLFAYGGSTLILASYLSALGISDERIGLFMTLTLVGDVFISWTLTQIADQLGRRWILVLGAALMSVAGVVFGLSGNYWILLAGAIVGVISPSGNEIGPFRAIEESTLAHLTASGDRSDIYAWYSLIGTAGTALGFIASGWIITFLRDEKHFSDIRAYRIIYFVYTAVGIVKLGLALLLSKECEVHAQPKTANPSETAPLLGDGPRKDDAKKNKRWRLLPDISKESQVVLVQLCILFAFDNFASGLAPVSWVTFYFKRRFDLSEGRLGSIFSVTGVISAISMLVASSISKRIGNVKTMVFTHLPSAICLALIPIPSTLAGALVFLIGRACTQVMDVAPRSAFLAAIVLPHERTAVMGTINVVKTCAQSLGPVITGILGTHNLFWVAFVAAGSLKATYDLGLLALFAERKSREERVAERIDPEQAATGAGASGQGA
ncbi:major facilitator superfamily domain-containing protein [Exophiala viscosa]|uniref:major facilitator superfamily domain-containing protein n=1 Tax=Exophiala viscosa TaxID=2486360 RepID=UPI00219B94F1|nr:major facilitator superfamily domain-containing protein [Exophiala viscosa]